MTALGIIGLIILIIWNKVDWLSKTGEANKAGWLIIAVVAIIALMYVISQAIYYRRGFCGFIRCYWLLSAFVDLGQIGLV